MRTSEKIKKELKLLCDEHTDFLELVTDNPYDPKFGKVYQNWYSRAIKLVELLGQERLEEFTSYYRIDPKRKKLTIENYVIQDYIKGLVPAGDRKFDRAIVVELGIMNQVQILQSLESRIESILQDVTGHLLADIQDSELKVADQLRKVSLRAAGALAGVILEGHLQRVAENHNISIGRKKPTIANLNEPLKDKGIYDKVKWRKIQHLADIRNLCSHQKEREPTDEEVVELISGVNWVIKSIF